MLNYNLFFKFLASACLFGSGFHWFASPVGAEYSHDKEGHIYYFKFAFIGLDGSKIFDTPDKTDCSDFSDGRTLAKLNGPNVDKRCAYLDLNGKAVASGLLGGESFSDGLAAVGDNEKVGFIDTDGKVVIAPHFEQVREFQEGLAPVRVNQKCGYIDKSGNFAIDPFFDGASGFSEGLAAVCSQGKVGFIDRQGNWKISPRFEYVDGFSDGLALVSEEDAEYFIDREGKRQIELSEAQRKRQFCCDGVSNSGLRSRSSLYGCSVGSSNFQNICTFKEGLSPMISDGKYGYIDKSGKFVIPAKFDLAYPFTEGLGRVVIGKKQGFVDKSGTLVITAKYLGAKSFSEGRAAVAVAHQKWGFIDLKGKEVVPPKYVHVNSFKNGRAYVQLTGWFQDDIE